MNPKKTAIKLLYNLIFIYIVIYYIGTFYNDLIFIIIIVGGIIYTYNSLRMLGCQNVKMM